MSDQTAARNPIPLDPDARALYHLSVPCGAQAIIHIEGCQDLVYAVNPTDGRPPFLVMGSPDQREERVTHHLHRKELNDGHPE